MSKFKKGDKVRCTDDSGNFLLSVGKIYTVRRYDGGDYVHLDEWPNDPAGFWIDRFELVNDEVAPVPDLRVWCGICGTYVKHGEGFPCAAKFENRPDVIMQNCGAVGKPWEPWDGPDAGENGTVKEEVTPTSWEHDGWEKLGQDYNFQAKEDDFYISNVQSPPARDSQVGGDHYRKLAIQPYEYTLSNNLGGLEHTIIKYVTRWKDKGGVKDLKKARHTLDFLIEWAETHV